MALYVSMLLTLLAGSLLAVPAASDPLMTVCEQPYTFTVVEADGLHEVYATELLIKSVDDVTVEPNPKTGMATVLVNKAEISFRANMLPSYNAKPGQTPKEISWSYNGDILGIASLVNTNNDGYTLRDCQMLPLSIFEEGSNLLPTVMDNIRKFSLSCFKSQVCSEIGRIKSPIVRPSFMRSVYESEDAQEAFAVGAQVQQVVQSINDVVDKAIKITADRIKEEHLEVMNLPEITHEFSTGSGIFKVNGKLFATDGTFKDLSTIKRTTDAALDSEGNKYTATCAFGLETTYINYNRYNLQYGFFNINGEIYGDIRGLEVEGSVSVDYGVKPCVMGLQYIKVKNFGKPDLKLTGLGPLNHLASMLLNSIAEESQGMIVELVEINLKELAESEIAKFDCESIRNETINSLGRWY